MMTHPFDENPFIGIPERIGSISDPEPCIEQTESHPQFIVQYPLGATVIYLEDEEPLTVENRNLAESICRALCRGESVFIPNESHGWKIQYKNSKGDFVDFSAKPRLTDSEFQSYCHGLPEEDAIIFGKGCIAFNKKLFGNNSILKDQ